MAWDLRWFVSQLETLCGGKCHHRGLLTTSELTFVDVEVDAQMADAQGGPSAAGAADCLRLGSLREASRQLWANTGQSNCLYRQPAWALAPSL